MPERRGGATRGVIAVCCTVLHLCLGTVYAWSFFQTMLVRDYGWTFSQTAAAFSITIFAVGVSAALAGMALPRLGPRILAVAGSVLFAGGYLIASLALRLEAIWVFYLGYGVVGGLGIGMGYVTPVATAAKWFPRRKGLVTGVVVMGFGMGAFLLSKGLAPLLVARAAGDLQLVFLWLGIVFACVLIPVSLVLRDPPDSPWMNPGEHRERRSAGLARRFAGRIAALFVQEGTQSAAVQRGCSAARMPAGLCPRAADADAARGSPARAASARRPVSAPRPARPGRPARASAGEAAAPRLRTTQFAVMWTVFFFNIAAGISVISFQSELLQDVWRLADPSLGPAALAANGATLIAASSICNGAGRLFWGMVSDRLGQVTVFRILLASQMVVFGVLMTETNPWVFSALVCYVLLCFGGGFATMPSFIIDVFGARSMSKIYGAVLTAWAAAGIVGPMYVGYLKDTYPDRAVMYCFLIGILMLGAGYVFSYLLGDGRIRLGRPTVEATLRRYGVPVEGPQAI